MKNRDRKVLHIFIKTQIHPDTKRIMTDDWPAYDGIGDEYTTHEIVNHIEDEYIRGDAQTNTR